VKEFEEYFKLAFHKKGIFAFQQEGLQKYRSQNLISQHAEYSGILIFSLSFPNALPNSTMNLANNVFSVTPCLVFIFIFCCLIKVIARDTGFVLVF